jgi:tetratricopeptide (TPR) repeat protein
VTYPDPDVETALTERFILLKLDLFNSLRQQVRPLNVIWTPTILFADRRGTVHYQNLNFLPPSEFLAMLDLGESSVDLRWTRTDQAIERLKAAYERDPSGLLADEILYWWGIAVFLKTRSNPQMYEIWDRLREQFPDSIWSARVP